MLLNRAVEGHVEEVVTLGSDYGASTVPRRALVAGAIAVCVGAGEDITFDVELNKAGLNVYTLDPTPRAMAHVEKVVAGAKEGRPVMTESGAREPYQLDGFNPERFKFLPLGIWIEDGPIRFYAPSDHDRVSHSILNMEQTGEYFEAQCVTLQSFQKSIGEEIGILKLDIMGAETNVIKHLVETKFFVPILSVELDEAQYPNRRGVKNRLFATINLLRGAGYKFVHLNGSNALFVRPDQP